MGAIPKTLSKRQREYRRAFEKSLVGNRPLEFAQSGEYHSSNKLTWEQVDAIRALRGELPRRKIAAKFGVSPFTVRDILLGKSWKPETRHCIPKSKLVTEFVCKHQCYSTYALARHLYALWPDAFSSLELARTLVRKVRGCNGVTHRQQVRDKSQFCVPAGLVDG